MGVPCERGVIMGWFILGFFTLVVIIINVCAYVASGADTIDDDHSFDPHSG